MVASSVFTDREERLVRQRPGLRTVAVVLALGFAGLLPPAAARADHAAPVSGGVVLSDATAPPAAPPPAPTTVPAPPPAPDAGLQTLPRVGGAPVTSPAVAPSGPPVVAVQAPQSVTGHKAVPPAPVGGPVGAPVAKPVATQFRAATGVPLPANPTLSLVPLGAVPIGVPNFFIDTFRIPPFLLPIYQAAGVEYDVPWQVLAAVNDIETNYGRNLSVSSAGALGWMQFLPETWKQYGVDANGDGVKDPYNPVDAIFGAARFLHAAGASQNLRGAIFAYNNANWYVDSVLLRAKLVGGMPADLVSSLTGLTDGLFPVHATAKYADDVTETAALAHQANTHTPSPRTTATNIYAQSGAPVIAVKDGVITAIGDTPSLGRFIALRDGAGNTYTYSQVGPVSHLYAAPKAQATAATAPVARQVTVSSDPAPHAPASAGHQPNERTGSPVAVAPVAPPRPATDTASGPQRLFAYPARRAAYAAGGWRQIAHPAPANLSAYLVGNPDLKPADVELKALAPGAEVVAGTILARIGPAAPGSAPHVGFQIRPAGKNAPLIDAKPILDGWKLLEATAIYRAAALNPIVAQNPTIGQILLESKTQLQRQVLADPAIDIYACGRRDIEAGLIDQRVLATLEFLSASGFDPRVTTLRCGTPPAGPASAPTAAGEGVDISAINGIPVLGHQGAGSITDLAIRRLLTLQGSFKPREIESLMSYPGADNAFAMPDHADRIHVDFAAGYPATAKSGPADAWLLNPRQWLRLINRLDQLPSPTVAAQPSPAAIPAGPLPSPPGAAQPSPVAIPAGPAH